MDTKRSASSARGKQAVKNAKHMPDSRLDFSDIADSADEELKRARRLSHSLARSRGKSLGRPKTGNAKQLIAIRIAPRLLTELRRLAAKQSKPYQTFIHELLERAAQRRIG